MADNNILDLLLGQLETPAPPNNLDFRLGEWNAATPAPGETPEDWARRIVQERYTDEEFANQFPDNAAITNACKLLGEYALTFGDDSLQQQIRLAELQAVPNYQLAAAAGHLLDLRRGYSAAELVAHAAQLAGERNTHLATVRAAIRKTRERLSTRKVRNMPYLRYRHEDNLDALICLRDELTELDTNREAMCQISEQTALHFTGNLIPSHSLDAAIRSVRIAYHGPDRVNFPLRFLLHLSLGRFYELLDEWDGNNVDALLSDLADIVLTEEFVQTMIDKAQAGPYDLGVDRMGILNELKNVVVGQHWQSTGLIAVTQAEGVIWSFAHHLTARGIRICKSFRKGKKTMYSPYQWNYRLRDYQLLDAVTGRPRHQRKANGDPHFATSARQLIQATALQCVFPIELWGFLVGGFYDERNELAHGDLVVDRLLAAKAVLCLSEVIYTVNDCEERRKRGGNWRERI